LLLSENFSSKTVNDNRLTAVSDAAFKAMHMADSIQFDDFYMTLARFEEYPSEHCHPLSKKMAADAIRAIHGFRSSSVLSSLHVVYGNLLTP